MKNFRILAAAALTAVLSCDAQSPNKEMNEKNNPLLCDPETGLCEIPGAEAKPGAMAVPSLRVIYFTDPICSACWCIEPQLRKLSLEYGAALTIEYHMGGLLPSWDVYNAGGISKPSDVAHHWEEMSKYFGMPIDGDVWLQDPLNSSYPPCIAFKAAEMQGHAKAAGFLRRIREMVFLEKKNITRWEHIKQAALEAGLDTARLAGDYSGKAQQLFRDDLSLGGVLGVRGFPALFIRDSLNNQATVYGYKPYSEFEAAVKKLSPDITKRQYEKKDGHLFNHFTTMTLKEYMVLAGLDEKAALSELDSLEKSGKITKTAVKNGAIWKRKQG